MDDGSLISALMPGARVDVPPGTFIFPIADKKTFIPPIRTSSETTRWLGTPEQIWPSQLRLSPIQPATRRLIQISGSPVSTQPRTRLVEPSGRDRYMSMTTRLCSSVMGMVADLGSDCGLPVS